MKKFLSILLVLVLVASVFVGCNPVEQPDGNETEAPKATLEKAVEFLVTTYKSAEGKETSNNYELIPQINIDGVSFTVTWTVDNTNISITKDASGYYVVNLPTNNAEKCEYTLTATVTAPDGTTATKTMKRVLPVIEKVEGVETELKAETAYKLFFDQKGVGKVLFLTAETSGNYIKTVTDPKAAADFYAEAAEGGFKVYTLVNGAKSYIKASTVPKDDGKVSKVIGFDAAGSVFKYNKDINAWYTNIDGTNYTMGTYGTYETVSISEDSYYTPENTGVSQFPVQFIEKAAGEAMAPSVGPADPTELTSIKDASDKGLAMEHNTFTVEKYLVKGTVTEIANTQYGNLYIEDGEGNKIYVYGLYNNDGTVRFDAMTTQPKVGDIITVMSVIGQYNGTAQLKNAWLMNIEVPELTDAQKVAAEKEELSIDADGVIYLDTVITLPAKGASHETVTITWAAPADYAGKAVAFDATAGKVTVTVGDAEETYKLTATIKSGDVTDTKEITLTIAKKVAYTVNVVSAPVANTAYKLYFTQLKAGKALFVNGEVDGRYLKTTMNVLEAVDVYAEAVEGGYKFYTLVDGAKAYLNAYLNDSNKSSLNFAAESACVFKYNAETFAWEVTVGEKTYYPGSYNAFETVSLSESKYINAENTRVAQFPLELVEIVCGHDFDATKCESTCTICGAVSEPNHKYDNDCDAKCNVCDAERQVADHVYDNACDAKCNVCDAERSVADHVYDNACDAKCNVCDAERQVADHVYDDACDAQCNECKAERTAPHAFAKDCEEKCDKCGATRTTETKHTYEFECDKACKICGETRKADCVDKDENGTCDVCQKVIDKAEVEKSHIAYEKEQITFADVKCDALTVILPVAKDYEDVTITWTCEKAEIKDGNVTFTAAAAEQIITLVATFKCGETTETAEYTVKVLAHTFEKACSEACKVCRAENVDADDHTWGDGCVDGECDVCGAERTAAKDHAWENACDAKCDACGAVRTVADHVYENACDANCNVCNAEREVGPHTFEHPCSETCKNCSVTNAEKIDHTYDVACDAECNVCGYKRDADHTVSGDCDEACNVCGAKMETTAEHTYHATAACDTECDVCGKLRTSETAHVLNVETGKCTNCETKMVYTISEALAAPDGTEVIVTGIVANIREAWSSYNNMSVDIIDESGKVLYVYRFKTEVKLCDIIVVTGKMTTYSGSRQIASGATAEITGKGELPDPEEITISEALAAADGTRVKVSGTVYWIKDAYNSSYNNISVYIVDEAGNYLFLYRLLGNYALGDTITVVGAMATYNNSRQVAQGGTAEKTGTAEYIKPLNATIEQALAAADGAPVIVSGTVKSVDGEGSVTITDGTNDLFIYKLSKNVYVNDVITVTGVMTTNKETRQINQGATFAVDTAHTCDYEPAKCTTPKTCKYCGKTQGDALGHNYQNGVCVNDGCGKAAPTGNEVTVSKSHTDIAAIAGVTVGQNTGVIVDKQIALDENVTLVCAKGGSTSNPCIYTESIRLYQNGATMTFTSSNGKVLKSIIITLATKSGGQGPITVSGGTASELTDYTYTITVDEDVTTVVVTTAGTDKDSRLYVANIKVIYE